MSLLKLSYIILIGIILNTRITVTNEINHVNELLNKTEDEKRVIVTNSNQIRELIHQNKPEMSYLVRLEKNSQPNKNNQEALDKNKAQTSYIVKTNNRVIDKNKHDASFAAIFNNILNENFETNFAAIIDENYYYYYNYTAKVTRIENLLNKIKQHGTTLIAHFGTLQNNPIKNTPIITYNFKNSIPPLQSKLFIIHTYIFIIESSQQLATILHKLHKTQLWNTSATVLIIIIHNGNPTTTSDIFNLTWKYYLINVWIFSDDLYTYNPIDKACTSVVPKKVTKIKPRSHDYFPGCALTVIAPPLSPYVIENGDGFEVKILKAICEQLSMRFIFAQHNYTEWGRGFANGTYTDMFELLNTGAVNVLFGGIQAISIYLDDFEMTTSHYNLAITAFAPVADELQPWQKVMLIFQWRVWLAILGSFAVVGGVGYVMDDFNYFNVWRCLFSVGIYQPRTASGRFIFISWAIFSLHIVNVFQCNLISFLFQPVYGYQISNIYEACNYGMDVGGVLVFRNTYNNESNEEQYGIYKRWFECSLTDSYCLDRVVYQKDFVYIKLVRSVLYEVKNDRRMKGKLYMFDTVPQYPAAMYVNKGFYAVDKMNEMILRLRQSGFITKWDRYEHIEKNHFVRNKRDFANIHMGHLLLPFAVLFIGNCIALGVFLLEIYFM